MRPNERYVYLELGWTFYKTCSAASQIRILVIISIIIWLRGPAGSGKSTILNTLAHYFLKLRRQGAFLFWDRNDPDNSEPRHVVHTLAHQLALFDCSFAEELHSQIEARPRITESSLDAQFQHLLQEPLAAISTKHDWGPIVIVLDALDECGTPVSRKSLLKALSSSLPNLPNRFRLLIASRDEPDIDATLSRLNIDVHDVPIDDESTSSDIKLLFQQHLASDADVFVRCGLPPDWPGERVIQRLVTLSGGLFIWASTTIRFIESGFPEERLEKVLSASAQGTSHARLDDLYRVALTHPFESYDESELEAVHSILGAIVVSREQLTDEQLSRLLGLTVGKVHHVLSRLQPLLRGGHGRPAQLLHTSFTDFLCDPKRCPDPQWHVNASIHHLSLASGCFQVMHRDLKLNICGIETSYCRNKEIPGIEERINQAITPVLMYASQYWADHLESGFLSTSDSPALADAVIDFINNRLLYWIEVFSLKDRMSMLSIILNKAVNWARV